ncbi:MAG: BREX-1 system adenine-specific DNA-methyltransferase PglX [Candidatus Aminicenantes bacterium]|jgi:hypothetical protein
MNETTLANLRDFSQNAKKLLQKEANEIMEGIYGFLPDSTLAPAEQYPALKEIPAAKETRQMLEQYIENEKIAGLTAQETRKKLLKEVAFTWLNRLIAFMMMETCGLISQTISRGTKSNGFLKWLIEPGNEDNYQLYEKGDLPRNQMGEGPRQQAYRNYILHLCEHLAIEANILFDTGVFAARFFPRPRVLNQLIEKMNDESLREAWQPENDETIGWVYQYFIQDEKDAVFHKIYKQKKKMQTRDLPAATQIFTPKWIVRYLVENTLGRLWLRMHPDSKLQEKMDYYVPNDQDSHAIELKSVKDITLLDPACGTMHFGMTAFDLFYKMYLEEIANKGKPGWPESSPVNDNTEIPQCIVEYNIYGIDIDLRSIQLSALSLYIKAKSKEKKAKLSRYRLTCTDIPILTDEVIKDFVDRLDTGHRVTKKLLMEILPLLNKAYYLGSLLKIEEAIESFIENEKVKFDSRPAQRVLFEEFKTGEQKQLDLYYESSIVWEDVKKELVTTLEGFSAGHPHTSGAFLAGESVKGLGLIDALIRKHDVVVSNPPYSGSRNWTKVIGDDLKAYYGKKSGDLYSCFIDRCIDLTQEEGFTGMLTVHTFMFTSSFEIIRKKILQETAIETLCHLGTRSFGDLSNPNAQGFVMYSLKKSTGNDNDENTGVYFRLVKELNLSEKHKYFFYGLADLKSRNKDERNIFFKMLQHKFKVIRSWPFVFWISDNIRTLFEKKLLIHYATPRQGLITGDNFRFIRFWWESGISRIYFNATNHLDTLKVNFKWYPYMKGGELKRWYGNQDYIVNWGNNGKEIKNFFKNNKLASRPQNIKYYFHEGVTFSSLTISNLSVRYLPKGFIFDAKGSSIFTESIDIYYLLGILNSKFISYLSKVINPTIDFNVGDIAIIPFAEIDEKNNIYSKIDADVGKCIFLRQKIEKYTEIVFEFSLPPDWHSGIFNILSYEKQLLMIESVISESIYKNYGIDQSDIEQIESEFGKLPCDMPNKKKLSSEESKKLKKLYLQKHVPAEVLTAGEDLTDEEGETTSDSESPKKKRGQKRFLTFEEICLASELHPETVYNFIVDNNLEREEERAELAFQWISYAVGIIMGRFKPGVENALGRGQFSKELNSKLNELVDEDAIMVIDEGHNDDLPAKVMQALEIMLGADEAAQVVKKATGKEGSSIELLRPFLGNPFFKRHIKQYRNRPVYWLLQSPNRKYSVWIFHERLNKDTLFRIRTEYVEPKKNHLDAQAKELKNKIQESSGREKKELEIKLENIFEVRADIQEFSRILNFIIEKRGYIPHPDDGVLLNMAPLWEIVPSWQKEPKKAWEALENGEYDWAYQAMDHWPDRVKEKCKIDKSLAIAHGLE